MLSYLDRPPSDGGGVEAFSDPTRWEEFVQAILEVTIQAYQILRKKEQVSRQSEEDFFTIHLKNCLRPLALERGIRVQSQFLIDSPEIIAGQIAAKDAKRLDLYLYSVWEQDYDKIYFTWECKRITPDSENDGLIYKYVVNGIIRFLHEEWRYAGEVNDSGILGYMLSGNVETIVEDINQKMITPPKPGKKPGSPSARGSLSLSSYPFSTADHLQLSSPLATFEHIYQSRHYREFRGNHIRLYHLFLTFDFDKIGQEQGSNLVAEIIGHEND